MGELQGGLVPALRQLCERTAAAHAQSVDFSSEGSLSLPREVEEAWYRIAQEALHNTVKHAAAARASVTLLIPADGGVDLRITDDGRGMPAERMADSGRGLRIMEYRATQAGSDFSIESPADGGTEVVCRWPSKRNDS